MSSDTEGRGERNAAMATVRIHNNSDEEVRKGCRLVLVGAGHAHVCIRKKLRVKNKDRDTHWPSQLH
jgi:hypothetical protein